MDKSEATKICSDVAIKVSERLQQSSPERIPASGFTQLEMMTFAINESKLFTVEFVNEILDRLFPEHE